MKKIFLCITFSCALAASAQNSKNESKPWKGFTLNPFVTGGISNSTYKINTTYTSEGQGMASLGAQVGYVLNSHVGFYSGLSFTQYNWHIPIGTQNIKDATSMSNYIQIPIVVKATTSKYNKVGFQVEAGFYLGFLTSVEEKINYLNGAKSDKSTSTEYYNKSMISFYVFYGLRIPLSKSTWMSVGFDDYVFLKNQYNDDDGKVTTAGIRIGVETKLTK